MTQLYEEQYNNDPFYYRRTAKRYTDEALTTLGYLVHREIASRDDVRVSDHLIELALDCQDRLNEEHMSWREGVT